MQHHAATRPAPPHDVTLRAPQPADVPTLFMFESDPSWCAMAMVKPRSWETFEAVWAKIFQDWAAGDARVVQKTILADGQVCGTIGCHLLGDRYVVGYGLGRPHWGRGIASRAVAQLLAETPQRPLYATAAASNTASIRVLAKHGFVIAERRVAPATDRCLAREEVTLKFG
jgi:RimJ/RimL family protein N-acetyltransferase